jgi:hypothetical protein
VIDVTVKGAEEIRALTDVQGAELLEVKHGIATVTLAKADCLRMPFVMVAEGAKMVARIHLRNAKTDTARRFVHVAQHSGGQLIGGVSLELRPRKKRGSTT